MKRNASVAEWRESGTMLRVGEHAIFARNGGNPNGPVLLLIHGFPTSSWDWEPVWSGLSKTHRLICFDMLGFGFSDKPSPHRYTIFEQADIAQAVLRHFSASNFHLLAHDYGDTVAQELMARNLDGPQACTLRSVCLLNGGLFPESHRLLRIQKLLLSSVGPLVARLSSRSSLALSMRKIFGPDTQPKAALLDGLWELIKVNHGNRAMAQLIRYVRERREFRERWVGALQRTTLPLKLINGPLDPISGAHMIERFRELVAKANVTELPGIGHYPQIESPSGVVAAYDEFRKKLD
ncbi:alpha/beta fold hydrolase [Dokdonella sp.]|uniref:alpha/beta fold hydrolase n=1 Tax=Dokdonella sp. TaxID=2291710 RepID=UPI003C3F56DB